MYYIHVLIHRHITRYVLYTCITYIMYYSYKKFIIYILYIIHAYNNTHYVIHVIHNTCLQGGLVAARSIKININSAGIHCQEC